MIVVITGVSGSGKSTIGTKLAGALRCAFLEGDALHPPANIEKMSQGVPLNDEDRAPWLAAVRARIVESFARGDDLVVACSALKEKYRRLLAHEIAIRWVFLKASRELIRQRLESRPAHFMKSDLLASQFEALEEPAHDTVVVDAALPPEVIVTQLWWQLVKATDLRVATDLQELSAQTATAMVHVIDAAIRDTGRCSLALSGGQTPRVLYGLLGSSFRDRIAWEHVHVFWGDERYVPPDDPESNYRMARVTLLDHVPCPEANVHPMRTHFSSPEAAAEDYERTLRDYFGAEGPSFDVNLLGLGSDGHTASIFAGSPALKERSRWVMSARTQAVPSSRLTLTLAALTQSKNIFVLVSGSNKAEALKEALSEGTDADTCPAAGIRQSRGRVTWWADRDAVSQLAQT